MSSKKGIIETCDRCGISTFRKYLKTEDYDGGFTKLDNFEALPNGWHRYNEPNIDDKYNTVTLCPKCSSQYIELFANFIKIGGDIK